MVAALEAILIEDDRDEMKYYLPIWENILRRVWPNITLQAQDSFDEVAVFGIRRPHIAIIDNVLQIKGGEVDNRGLILISEMKKEYADTLFILFTGRSFTIESLGYRIPNPDLIVTKTAFPNERYEKSIAAQISERISRLPIQQISFSKPSDLDGDSIDRLEIQSLVEQCLQSFQSFRKEYGGSFEPLEQVSLTKLGGGRSGAGIFKCELFRKEGTANSQFVFKYTDLESIGREIENYHKFVRLQIPHHVRVDLVGVGKTRRYGAAFYGFAFGKSSLVSSLTGPLKAGRTQELFDFVESVMNQEAIGWYQFSGEFSIIEEYFNNGLEYSTDKDSRRLSGIRSNMMQFFPEEGPKVSDGGIEFSDFSLGHARSRIKRMRGERLPMFVCHGDLNSNNIMIFDGRGMYSLIDFEYTGLDSVYKDFVSLEVSLRLNFPAATDPDELPSWFAAEDEIAERSQDSETAEFGYLSPSVRELSENILLLRRKMFEFLIGRNIDVNIWHYECALSFHLFKVAALRDWNREEFGRLLFSYLASLNALGEE